VAFTSPIFVELVGTQQHYVQTSNTQIHRNRTTDVGSMDGSKKWLSLRRFSWNSSVLNSIMYRRLTHKYTEIGQQMWKVWTEVKSGFYCADFHETEQNVMHFRGYLPYRTLSKAKGKVQKPRKNVHLLPQIYLDLHGIHFHETHNGTM